MDSTVKRAHSLTIKGNTTITGVTQVISLEEKEVRVAIGDKSLCLTGVGFAAEKLSIEEGMLVLNGEVREVRYLARQDARGLLKRLFK